MYMFVPVCVLLYVCMNVRMPACMCECVCGYVHRCMCVCMYVCMFVCLYVCTKARYGFLRSGQNKQRLCGNGLSEQAAQVSSMPI